ncbi:hypothetical protein LWI29_028788 [Acer saccharum]|uniref:Disease resistance R13L4/SHOC-2-like LRR domain-containing protein n=1 Tax=Acer saccharum TaxID=4024 RepID=A0AA39SXK3_ACESA|nr:hypothetical protein LWI29_028788 [Acer saccharum]
MYEAQERGRFIIESLKLVCLLEGSYEGGLEGNHVKMHDVLRDMAHWLACEEGNEILVKEHTGLIKSQEIGRWKDVVRVSLHGGSTQFLIEAPVVCTRLQTIFVMDSSLATLPGTFFQSIHTLTVLNLSKNTLLKELPVEIGALISLRYLNLSKTSVSYLPIEVKNLTQLRILLLDEMMFDIVIPAGVISSLSSLQMYSCFNFDNQCKIDLKLIEELECLEKITHVGLSFSSVSPVLKFVSSSPKLQSCITRLSTYGCKELSSLDISCSSMRRMEHLEELYIRFCFNLREVKICFENGERLQRSDPNCFYNLQILHIWDCATIENLTWLIYTPRLRFLHVLACKSLEEIIAWDFAGSSEIEEATKIFSNLEKANFEGLPKLKSICRRAIPFPSLRYITVYNCPSLRKLPLSAESAKGLKEIKGNTDWWDKLEWEDEATNLAFTSKFQP